MRVLEASGYVVFRSAASRGEFDLIGVSATDVVLCQVKSNRAPSPAERETLAGFRCPTNCRRLIHVWKDRARFPVVAEV